MPKAAILPKPKNDNGYFEQMVFAIFISGFSRKVIESKWEGFKEVFENFDITKVALWGDKEMTDALTSTRIIRNAKKIESAVANARILLEKKQEFGSVEKYIASLGDESVHAERLHAIQKEFRYMGPKSANMFLYFSGEKIPGYNC